MITNADRHIGEKVRHFRILKGMTQKELGRIVGVRFQQIQKYEHGRNRISVGTLWAISKTLDVPVVEFFKGLSADESGESENSTGMKETREHLEIIRLYAKMRPGYRHRVAQLMREIGDAP